MESEKELDYLYILKALKEIPFNVGRKLLIDFLQGDEDNKSVQKNKLFNFENFGTLAYDKEELNQLIESLIQKRLVAIAKLNNTVGSQKFWKLLEITERGRKEIENPSIFNKKTFSNYEETKTIITDEDKRKFEAFGDFLSKFNDEQKKVITHSNSSILCIAGAGSGKTTVLTKRIEYLVKYKSTDPSKILAITFTRKARQEMINRLSNLGLSDSVMIETFNSFCEKILRQHNNLLYDRQVRVTTYRDKINIINRSLSNLNLTMDRAINIYFTYAQRRSKTNEQLANIFLNDCFFIRDYFKFKNKKIDNNSFESYESEHKESSKMMFSMCNYIDAFMRKNGLRDFADQLIDALELFEKNKELIPKFDHILIDEYQDVNSTQIKLIDILNPENIFCVGDPRQSIYGWRGSDIKYILDFKEKYKESDILSLTKNYRSTKSIVQLINTSLKNLNLPDLESSIEGEKDIRLINFDSEDAESEFVIQGILQTKTKRDEIFVLARTNRQLNELSQKMKLRGISHVVRSDELRKTVIAKEGEITLATIHAIKGLEAEMVFVIGCTSNRFPCKASEHPVIDMIIVDEYDKEEEERRLLYVAMSRAKKSLYLTYSGKSPTYFITKKMLELISEEKKQVNTKFNISQSNDVMTRLKDWRTGLSKAHNIPSYMIMHDRTIVDIAVKMPMSKEDLGNVYGFGPAKIQKYGEEILKVVNGMG
ncbi:MAG: ATP-dependent DNA helicase UvrD2 [Candidatus Woesearchaeota archaeon]|nr:ATP-dependent DNA helicase UvrD2 [Candidatus Woesearchaeota archaeon]